MTPTRTDSERAARALAWLAMATDAERHEGGEVMPFVMHSVLRRLVLVAGDDRHPLDLRFAKALCTGSGLDVLATYVGDDRGGSFEMDLARPTADGPLLHQRLRLWTDEAGLPRLIPVDRDGPEIRFTMAGLEEIRGSPPVAGAERFAGLERAHRLLVELVWRSDWFVPDETVGAGVPL